MVSGDHLRGGPGEIIDVVGLPPTPVEACVARFQAALVTAAAEQAPGPSSAPWANFVVTADRLAPGLVSVGETWGGAPALTPFLGETHITIGNPALLVPVKVPTAPSKVRVRNAHEYDKALEGQQADARLQNQLRLSQLRQEHQTVVDIAVPIATRVLASLQPGTVRLTVCDQHSRGKDFFGFTPLGKESAIDGKPVFSVTDNPSTLLAELSAEIDNTRSSHLDGSPTMRHQAMNDRLMKPWRVVVLMGDCKPKGPQGQLLDPETQRLLDKVIEDGPACGISLIYHGYAPSRTDGVNRLIYNPTDGTYTTSAVKHLPFAKDKRPSQEFVVLASRIIAEEADKQGEINTPSSPPVKIAANTSGAGYAAMVRENLAEIERAKELEARHHKVFPWLNPDTLAAISNDERPYHQAVVIVASSGVDDLRKPKEDSPIDQLQIEALLRLGGSRLANVAAKIGILHTSRNSTVRRHMQNMAQLVGITSRHGQEAIGTAMQPYIEYFLQPDPPAWAFQLVSDEIIQRGWRADSPADQAIIDHVLTDITTAFGLEPGALHDDRGRINRELATSLARCRMLQLYDFANAPEPVRVMLTRYTEHAIELPDPDQMPAAARPIYDQHAGHLDKIGRIPTVRQRLTAAIGALSTPTETEEPLDARANDSRA